MNNIGRFIVLAAIVLGIGALVYTLDYLPGIQKAKRLADEVHLSEQKLARVRMTIHSAREFTAQHEAWFKNYLADSPDDQVSASMMADLQKAAAQHQLNLSVLNARSVANIKKQKVFSVVLRTGGALSDLVDFIEQIEDWPQRFHISTFSLKADPQDVKQLGCQIEFSKAYFIEE